MTLLQQLYAIVTGVFIALFIGSVAIDDALINADSKMQLQRIAHTQSASHPANETFSVADATALADGLISTGSYREITVTDRLNTPLAHRAMPQSAGLNMPSVVADVPAWCHRGVTGRPCFRSRCTSMVGRSVPWLL